MTIEVQYERTESEGTEEVGIAVVLEMATPSGTQILVEVDICEGKEAVVVDRHRVDMNCR